jgi:hypothetical protein
MALAQKNKEIELLELEAEILRERLRNREGRS